MATISPKPRFRAFDSNGAPLDGGLLYTYEAGTTTPKATFTTEAGDVANANPVVLDSDGYADVWLGDGGYKYVLKTSADVTLWTVDDLGGTSSIAFGASVNSLSSNVAITGLYANSMNICTSNPTLSLLSAASAGEGFYFTVKNQGSGVVTIDPDAAETIDGSATLTIKGNESAIIICDGTDWYSAFKYEFILNNYAASAAPTTADDSGDGYAIGSRWIDTSASPAEAYVCVDATAAAAIWLNTTLEVGDLGSAAVADLIDDDTFATATATNIPSAESVKAYVDNSNPIPAALNPVAGGKGDGTSANYDGDGILNDISGMTGVTSITRTGSGIYSVVLDDTMASADYVVLTQTLSDTDPTTPTNAVRNFAQVDTYTTTGFRLTTGTNTSGSVPTDARILSFIVFGEKA